jgi:lysophospholipid acyltransferase (LPLAT)-like uncharacterized protein
MHRRSLPVPPSSFQNGREANDMKIRNPWLIQALGFLAALLVRLWVGTVRYRYRPLGVSIDPHQPNFRPRYLYAFWHENILLPAYQYGRPDIYVLISGHADGQLIAEVCRHLRFRLVRGSTTRGGFKAIRQMILLARKYHLAVTPDGPRGPRRQVQPGLVYLAARTGLPIVPMGIAWRRAWRLRSWDRFALPFPWSTASMVTTDPIHVPATVDKDGLEAYRIQVQRALQHATAVAERMAA